MQSVHELKKEETILESQLAVVEKGLAYQQEFLQTWRSRDLVPPLLPGMVARTHEQFLDKRAEIEERLRTLRRQIGR